VSQRYEPESAVVALERVVTLLVAALVMVPRVLGVVPLVEGEALVLRVLGA
jgi:hypothetical protein